MRQRLLVLLALGFLALGFLAPIPISQAAPVYAFPIVGCNVHYAHSHHDYPATDILGKIGCKFVAVTSGVVDEVTAVDKFNWKTDVGSLRGGLSVSIVGDDGVRYYGSHLSKIAAGIKPGVRVKVGQLLGLLGNSGDAKGTASHVHFGISWPTPKGIWWVRRGELYPWRYLDLWRAGKDASPAKSVAALETKIGTIPKHVGY